MFQRKIQPGPGLSDAAPFTSTRADRHGPPPGTRLRRALKLAAAGVVLAAGAVAVLGEHTQLQSDSAVVSAPLLFLKAPIDGVVGGVMPMIGAVVAANHVFATIDDGSVARDRLADLTARVARLEADHASVQRHHDTLAEMLTVLGHRADAHSDAVGSRLGAELAGAEAAASASAAGRDQAARDLQRRQTLTAAGFAARADLEQARTRLDTASREAEGRIAAASALRIQQASARRGVLSDGGANDVAYSAQRRDEIAMRLTDIDQRLAGLDAERIEAASNLAAESERVGRLSHAEIASPVSGTVWRTGTSTGERIAKGQMVAELADCSHPLVLASLAQRLVPDLLVGGAARVKFAGEDDGHDGIVMSVLGERVLQDDHRMAALPATTGDGAAVILIALATAAADAPCQVGRSGRVVLPRKAGGPVSRVLAWLF